MAEEKLKAKIDIEVANAIRALKSYQDAAGKAGDKTEKTQTNADGLTSSFKKLAGGLAAGGTLMLGFNAYLSVLKDVEERQKTVMMQQGEMARESAGFAAQMNSLADVLGVTQAEAALHVRQMGAQFNITPVGARDILFGLKSSGNLTKENVALAMNVANATLDPGQEGVAASIISTAGNLGYDPKTQQGQQQTTALANQIYFAGQQSQWTTAQMADAFAKVAPLKTTSNLSDVQMLQMLRQSSVTFKDDPSMGRMAVRQSILAAVEPTDAMQKELQNRGIDPSIATVPQLLDIIIGEIGEAGGPEGTNVLAMQVRGQEFGINKRTSVAVPAVGTSDIWGGLQFPQDDILAEKARARRQEMTFQYNQAAGGVKLAEYEAGLAALPMGILLQRGYQESLESGSAMDINAGQIALSKIPQLGKFAGTDKSRAAESTRGAYSILFRRAGDLTGQYGADPRIQRLWANIPPFDPMEHPAQFSAWLGRQSTLTLDVAAEALRDIEENPPDDFSALPTPGFIQRGGGSRGERYQVTPTGYQGATQEGSSNVFYNNFYGFTTVDSKGAALSPTTPQNPN